MRDLVAAGEDVYEVRVLRSSLEDAYLEAVGRVVSGRPLIAGFSLRESLRRRVFLVVGLLTLGFLGALRARDAGSCSRASTSSSAAIEGIEARTVAGATILGLAMFATLFLGTILAVFLTLGAVRGDAERGLLQPVLVRPLRAAHGAAGALRRGGRRVRRVRDRRVPGRRR